MDINVTLEWDGNKFPFGIEKRCRVSRFFEVVGGGLGIEIEKVIHFKNFTMSEKQEITNSDKFLIEDCGIEDKQRILIIGRKTKDANLAPHANITLKYKDTKSPCQIFPHTQVRHILDLVRQNMDLIPDTIKLKFGDSPLGERCRFGQLSKSACA